MNDGGIGLAEAMLGLPGFRVVEVFETEAEKGRSRQSSRTDVVDAHFEAVDSSTHRRSSIGRPFVRLPRWTVLRRVGRPELSCGCHRDRAHQRLLQAGHLMPRGSRLWSASAREGATGRGPLLQ